MANLIRGAGLGLVVFGAVAAACGADSVTSQPGGCDPGLTRECLGPGACRGAQSCVPDRTWSYCDCGSEGAGGTSPASGGASTGVGGTQATGGTVLQGGATSAGGGDAGQSIAGAGGSAVVGGAGGIATAGAGGLAAAAGNAGVAGSSGSSGQSGEASDIYAEWCGGDGDPCTASGISCLAIWIYTEYVYSCSQRCTGESQCSGYDSATQPSDCFAFSNSSRCLLACMKDGATYGCPDGMSCVVTSISSGRAYCAW